MTPFMSLSEINTQLTQLVRNERKLTHEILTYINLFETCGGHLKMGYASMHQYLTKHLGYSDDQAFRRLKAARLIRQMPEVSDRIQEGSLNLSQAAQAQNAFDLAERTKATEAPLSEEAKKSVIAAIEKKNNFETKQILASSLDLPVKSEEHARPQADQSVRMQLTLTQQQFEKLKSVKSWLSHQIPNQGTADVLEYVMDLFLAKKQGVSPKERDCEKQSLNSEPKSKTQSSEMKKQEIWKDSKKRDECKDSKKRDECKDSKKMSVRGESEIETQGVESEKKSVRGESEIVTQGVESEIKALAAESQNDAQAVKTSLTQSIASSIKPSAPFTPITVATTKSSSPSTPFTRIPSSATGPLTAPNSFAASAGIPSPSSSLSTPSTEKLSQVTAQATASNSSNFPAGKSSAPAAPSFASAIKSSSASAGSAGIPSTHSSSSKKIPMPKTTSLVAGNSELVDGCDLSRTRTDESVSCSQTESTERVEAQAADRLPLFNRTDGSDIAVMTDRADIAFTTRTTLETRRQCGKDFVQTSEPFSQQCVNKDVENKKGSSSQFKLQVRSDNRSERASESKPILMKLIEPKELTEPSEPTVTKPTVTKSTVTKSTVTKSTVIEPKIKKADRSSLGAHRSKTASRYISVKTKQEVWKRAGGCCEYRNADGQRCHSRYQLQFDHIKAHAIGGTNHRDNLQILCRNHNLWKATQEGIGLDSTPLFALVGN